MPSLFLNIFLILRAIIFSSFPFTNQSTIPSVSFLFSLSLSSPLVFSLSVFTLLVPESHPISFPIFNKLLFAASPDQFSCLPTIWCLLLLNPILHPSVIIFFFHFFFYHVLFSTQQSFIVVYASFFFLFFSIAFDNLMHITSIFGTQIKISNEKDRRRAEHEEQPWQWNKRGRVLPEVERLRRSRNLKENRFFFGVLVYGDSLLSFVRRA